MASMAFYGELQSLLDSKTNTERLLTAVTHIVHMMEGEWYQTYMTLYEQFLVDNITKTELAQVLDAQTATMLATLRNHDNIIQNYYIDLYDKSVQIQENLYELGQALQNVTVNVWSETFLHNLMLIEQIRNFDDPYIQEKLSNLDIMSFSEIMNYVAKAHSEELQERARASREPFSKFEDMVIKARDAFVAFVQGHKITDSFFR